MNIMSSIYQVINKILGYDRKSEIIHDQKNRFAREMLQISVESRRLNRLIENSTAYRIAQATGRISND